MESVERAMEGVRAALAADDFDLELLGIEPGGVARVSITARPGACADCLVPDEVLVRILKTSIAGEVPDIHDVVLEKRGL